MITDSYVRVQQRFLILTINRMSLSRKKRELFEINAEKGAIWNKRHVWPLRWSQILAISVHAIPYIIYIIYFVTFIV